MALNIAVPLSGVEELLGEDFRKPIDIDCRNSLKVLCSPIDSESSGISSLDSEEIKVIYVFLLIRITFKK